MKNISLLGKFACAAAFSLFFSACSNDDNSLVVNFAYKEAMDRVYVWDTSDIVADGQVSLTWSSDVPLDFKKGTDRKYYFILPEQNAGGSAQITLTVKTGKSSGSVTKTIPVAQLDPHRLYGLGYRLFEERANNVAYGWYVDQNNTGPSSNTNCGPAACEMAGRWAREDFPMTAQQMRTESGVTGNWSTNNIATYLDINGVTNEKVDFTKFDDLKPHLDEGNIAILCLDIYYVRTESSSGMSEWRKDKFYTTSASSGHFVVVKGYKRVDGEYLLECYDPWSIGRTYLNGQYKGQDRYYRLSDILTASNVWWKYAIIVSPSTPVRSGRSVTDGWDGRGLDPATVPEQWG